MIRLLREEWGSIYEPETLDPGEEGMVVIHHAASPHLPAGTALSAEIAAIQNIERFHVHDRGWQAIGYNWLITLNGHVFEGRGWAFKGAHAGEVNGKSIGICFVMDGQNNDLTPAAIEACQELIAQGIKLGEVSPTFEMVGHRDVKSTTCPGMKIYPRLEDLRP